jgi:cytosine/adenosine deaminase-related metal-dependent hydrolase
VLPVGVRIALFGRLPDCGPAVSRRSDLVLVNLREPEHAADNIAAALCSRNDAVKVLRAMIAHLDPTPPASLFDGDAA